MTLASSATSTAGAALPLFVDLDGTLTAADTLHEALLIGLHRQPWRTARLLMSVREGKAALKQRLTEQKIMPDPLVLPYREDVLEFLREQKRSNRPLILTTASDGVMAHRVAEHLDLFDGVLGSNGSDNLKGPGKLAAIQRYCADHGWSAFAYMGDSPADLPIWSEAAEVYVVNPSRSLLARLGANGEPKRVFAPRRSTGRAIVRALRPHQWAKNVLVFAPLLLAHAWDDATKLAASIAAFVAFCLAASGVYVINDLMDLESDRHHASKRSRPFAIGALPIVSGMWLIVALLVGAATVSLLLPLKFAGGLLMYLALSVLYSLWLKRKLMVDVLVLAALYSLRIVGGGLASDIQISEWLFAFSGFLFTSLAFVKRYTELAGLGDEPAPLRGRGYFASDLSVIESVGPASGFMAVLVLALYINSEPMRELYANPTCLWLVCPLLLYWIMRIWFLARRGHLSDDPIVFALTDRISLLTGLTAAALVLLAMLGWGPRL